MIRSRDRREFLGAAAALGAISLAGRAVAETWNDPAGVSPPPAGSYGRLNPLFKQTEFVIRRDGLTLSEFRQAWLGRYGPALARRRGVAHLVLNTINHTRSPEVAFDGAAFTYYADPAAHAAAYGDPALEAALDADARALLQPWRLRMFTREIIIRDVEPGARWPGFKRIGLLKKRPDLSMDEFVTSWRDTHAPEANDLVGLRRYTLDVVDKRLSPDATWDGFATLWWDDAASFENSMALSQKTRATGDRAIQTSTLMFVDETIIV